MVTGGDNERTERLQEFLFDPAQALGLTTVIHGVRYPPEARQKLEQAGIAYRGWLPNYLVPETFARFRLTVHIPRQPYVEALPGIPTIRVFEALACGIPLICSPWDDCEGLFTPGKDYLVVQNGAATYYRGIIRALHALGHTITFYEPDAYDRQRHRDSAVAALKGGRPLNIVILGLSITSSWGNGHATTYRALVRALDRRGHNVLFLERDVPWYANQRDLPNPPYGRTALYTDLADLQQRFAPAVCDADLVIVGSYVPEGIAVGEWVTVAASGISAFYDIDTPVTLAKLAQNTSEYISRELIPWYDLYYATCGRPSCLGHRDRAGDLGYGYRSPRSLSFTS